LLKGSRQEHTPEFTARSESSSRITTNALTSAVLAPAWLTTNTLLGTEGCFASSFSLDTGEEVEEERKEVETSSTAARRRAAAVVVDEEDEDPYESPAFS